MNDGQFNSGRQLRRTQRGVSLIEVLVVLVILVTGILTIIRLFPSGFFSIQSTGNAALADSLGVAAVSAGAQDTESLPDAILPVNLSVNDLASVTLNASAYSNYDPDDPNNLENARVVTNETATIPFPSGTSSTLPLGHSIYTVRYGPIAIGTPTAPLDPKTSTALRLSAFMSVNSLPWGIQTGSSIDDANPKDFLNLDRPNYLVDYTNGRIGLPYALYSRDFVLTVVDANNVTHTLYLTVPKEHAVDTTNYLYGPITNDKLAYQVSEMMDYNGNWFDPADTTLKYVTSQTPTMPLVTPWRSVTLYRPFNWIQTGTAFDPNDPYQFQLVSSNVGGGYANTGAIAFNPLAGGAKGLLALKAQISYLVASWQILREDHDIPALTGTGSTAVVRTTVPNLLLAGSANPDNTINTGIAGSSNSLVILDLDTGLIVAPGGPADPTNPDSPINNEDLNGTMPGTNHNLINVSYSTGRLTFGSNAFGDNSVADGSGTAPAHRIRIFYTSDLNWTVAVQKVPSYFSQNTAATPTDMTPLGATEFAYDPAQSLVYFARCNAGRTVEIDGTYVTTISGVTTTKTFTTTVAVNPILYDVGAPDVRVALGLPPSATVTFTAVRGLSARAVVAWKERNVWKEHSVDAVLTRTP